MTCDVRVTFLRAFMLQFLIESSSWSLELPSICWTVALLSGFLWEIGISDLLRAWTSSTGPGGGGGGGGACWLPVAPSFFPVTLDDFVGGTLGVSWAEVNFERAANLESFFWVLMNDVVGLFFTGELLSSRCTELVSCLVSFCASSRCCLFLSMLRLKMFVMVILGPASSKWYPSFSSEELSRKTLAISISVFPPQMCLWLWNLSSISVLLCWRERMMARMPLPVKWFESRLMLVRVELSRRVPAMVNATWSSALVFARQKVLIRVLLRRPSANCIRVSVLMASELFTLSSVSSGSSLRTCSRRSSNMLEPVSLSTSSLKDSSSSVTERSSSP